MKMNGSQTRPGGNWRRRQALRLANWSNCTLPAIRAAIRAAGRLSVVYLAQVDPAALKPVAADDAEAVSWFPLDELPALAFDHAMILGRGTGRLKANGPA